MMNNLNTHLPLFTPFFSFEPNYNAASIKEAKNRFSAMVKKDVNIDELIEAFLDFPLTVKSIICTYETLEMAKELKNPSTHSLKELKRFKSNKEYLNSYIKSFQTTVEFYRNTQQFDKADELDETIRIFEKIKADPESALQWLIAEVLFDSFFSDDEAQKNVAALIHPSQLSSLHYESLRARTARRAMIYGYYFNGYNINSEDIYRNMLIRLYYLFNKYGVNKGRGDNNPNKHIETLMHNIREVNIKIEPKKMKNIYLKGFFGKEAIFDYKRNTKQKDAFNHYIQAVINNSVTQFFYSEELEENFKSLIIEQLLFN